MGTRDDVSCGCRFCCPCCTVLSVDGCVTSAALVYLLGWIFTLCCWEPKSDSEYCYRRKLPRSWSTTITRSTDARCQLTSTAALMKGTDQLTELFCSLLHLGYFPP